MKEEGFLACGRLRFRSEQELADWSRVFAQVPLAGRTIGLTGQLGAGKTTFVKHLCAQLAVTVPVTSPTFNLIHEYPGSGRLRRVEHGDLFRGGVPDDLYEPPDTCTLRIVEWIERDEAVRGMADLIIEFAIPATDTFGTARELSFHLSAQQHGSVFGNALVACLSSPCSA